MLRRKAYDRLLDWKRREGHKCLLVKGQRQVGKTFSIMDFGKRNYDRVVYLDLSRSRDARDVFKGNIDRVEDIVRRLAVLDGGGRLEPGSTLIVLDEIQECPSARTALKTFGESGLYDVIASGSLIDAVIRDDRALLPVGYEEHLTMRSLDFEEFLWAMGIDDEAVSEVRGCIRHGDPVPDLYMSRFSELFRMFMLVGGMPDAVSAFVASRDPDEALRIQEGILNTGRADIGKYGGRDRVRIEACFDSIPYQLSRSNKKFMYSRIGRRPEDGDELPEVHPESRRSREASREYGDSLTWIKRAAYGNYCYALNVPESPLEISSRPDHFKVYMSDTGLLMSMYGPRTRRGVLNGNNSVQKGALAENAVAECLVKAGYRPFYLSRLSGPEMMEIDFVLELGDDIAAVEVKSGKSRTAPSVRKVATVFPQVTRRIILEDGNVSGDPDGIEHYPLFAAAFIDELDPYGRTRGGA